MDGLQEENELLEAIDRGWLQSFGNTLGLPGVRTARPSAGNASLKTGT